MPSYVGTHNNCRYFENRDTLDDKIYYQACSFLLSITLFNIKIDFSNTLRIQNTYVINF